MKNLLENIGVSLATKIRSEKLRSKRFSRRFTCRLIQPNRIAEGVHGQRAVTIERSNAKFHRLVKIFQREDARLRSRDFFEDLPIRFLVQFEQGAGVAFRISLSVALCATDRDRHVRRQRIDGAMRDRIGNSCRETRSATSRSNEKEIHLRGSARRSKYRCQRCCSR